MKGKIAEAFRAFKKIYLEIVDEVIDHLKNPGRLETLLLEVTKGAVGIRVPLTLSLFGDGIPRRLLLRVSLAKPTSAALRF